MSRAERPFSIKWVIISMVVFILAEAVLGWFIGEYIVGSYISMPGDFRLQVVLYLTSYFVGGFIVGLVSPGLRLWEPALGAFLSAGAGFLLALFVPLSFFRLSTWKVLIGGVIAFALAMTGAEIGERLSGNNP